MGTLTALGLARSASKSRSRGTDAVVAVEAAVAEDETLVVATGAADFRRGEDHRPDEDPPPGLPDAIAPDPPPALPDVRTEDLEAEGSYQDLRDRRWKNENRERDISYFTLFLSL